MRHDARRSGFTLLELLIASTVMLVVVVSGLAIFSRSNKSSADQQQYVELQHDVRGAMFFLTRDIRMAGAGLPDVYAGWALEGVDNEATGTAETPDRLCIVGNIENPLVLRIANYSGSSKNVTIEDYSLERSGYPDSFYLGKIVMVLPNPSSGCNGSALREITGVFHNEPGTHEGFQFSTKDLSNINPKHGLRDVCADSDFFDGGSIIFADIREYWLDVTGSVSGLTAGQNGYIGGGVGGVLYMTLNGVHYPLAQNIESLQFQYNGDFDGDADGRLDGFQNWSTAWTNAQIGRIREVRIQILGRTRDVMASIGKVASPGLHIYRRPALANTAAAATDDWHKRFLLESSSAIRNLSMNLYNTGMR
ncbi:MAG: prepilin-type N-terminal cleavage/methylation domain-containing protein [Candidatus Aminicenantes bacterium]|nr:prepilin-type N-terminal cleavage/methylation domain-containing protein [Candidatus Aminicenantes bacterium]